VAADDQTVSIEVLDVSDFDGDDVNMNDEVPPSPRPPSRPRTQSETAERDSPRALLMGRRLVRHNHHSSQISSANAVSSSLAYQLFLCTVFSRTVKVK